MKAVTTMCGNTTTQGVASGRVHRHRRDIENEEIQMYLSKLKELVPFMPKNRRLSKLEVIQYVIDYICDLQYALESHPAVVQTAAAAMMRNSITPTTPVSTPTTPRQPLGVLAPNTILTPASCSTQEATTAPVHLLDKVVTPPSDSRPVSC
ncbi:basic helix-loop-helix domain-containing extra-macrochaetae [Lycorma delicatula]|uniref:basic helix-loop-helix domain-containing extra-macrochaetae n=1 Tax=Lycorma delicatula TaxID=130591 RepID=UPI003F517657